MIDAPDNAAPAGQPGVSHTTIDEYEQHTSTTPAPKASEFKLEGDDVPEEFRGKTASEVAKEAKAFQTALRLSEDARISLKTATESRQAAPAPAALSVPEPDPEPTREQLKELYDTDPLQAIQVMNDMALKRAEQHLNVRLGAMESGTATLAENWARQEYPDEFRVLGSEIQNLIDSIPNKAVFATKKGWEDAVAYVRGQRGNFEKVMDFRANGPKKGPTEARMEQEANAGFTGGNGKARSSIPASGPAILDETQKEIAKEFIASGVFKDEAEYVRWSQMGAR